MDNQLGNGLGVLFLVLFLFLMFLGALQEFINSLGGNYTYDFTDKPRKTPTLSGDPDPFGEGAADTSDGIVVDTDDDDSGGGA